MRPDSARSNRFARSLTIAFLLAGLGSEVVHTEEVHNPHGNRRERIEEMRQRSFEAAHSRHAQRNFNDGNGGPDPHPLLSQLRYGLRRRDKKGSQPA